MKKLLRLLPLFALFSLPLAAAEEEAFSQAELDQMLAPIALYPDSLLAQILTASTYPLEVVQASRWSQANPELKGAEAVDAVDDRDWDPSVKSLVAFPDVLRRMDEDLEWTQKLGNAVLLQEEEVMSSVQGLRQKAYAAGSLDSLENVRVHREREVIYIEPAEPRIVYVPYYRPTVVYGSWWWPAYPPVYWGPPATVYYSSGGTRIIWTTGVHISTGFFYSRPDWHRRYIVVHHHHHHYAPRPTYHASTRERSYARDGERWRHEPAHRRGVSYRSETLEKRYGLSTASLEAGQSQSERRSIRYAPRQTELENKLQAESRRTGSAHESASLAERPARERTPVTETRTSGLRTPTAVNREESVGVTVPNRVADRPGTAPTSLERRVRPSENRGDSIAARLASERPSAGPSTPPARAGVSSPIPAREKAVATPPDRGNSSNLRTFSAPSEPKPTTLRPAPQARSVTPAPQARPATPVPQARPATPAPQARPAVTPPPQARPSAPAPQSRPVQASSGVRPPQSLTAPPESTGKPSARETARSLGKK